MTMTPFDTAVAFTLREEGGFTDDPRDPGGATNLGITRATLTHWRGRPATADDVRNLTVAEADAIYQALYWHAMRCDLLPIGIALMVFDFGVNAGPGTSVRELQQTVGVATDGLIGPVTALAATGADRAGLIAALHDAHEQHYRGLDDFPVFGAGWLARLTRCTARAIDLAASIP